MAMEQRGNETIFDCEVEGCDTKLVTSENIDLDEVASFLQAHGWSWMLGDELYDHVCSKHVETLMTTLALPCVHVMQDDGYSLSMQREFYQKEMEDGCNSDL